MMKRKNEKRRTGIILLIVFAFIVDFVLVIKLILQGKNIALLNPKGKIAREQFELMVFTATIMFTAIVMALIILYFIAWKYRGTNSNAKYNPVSHNSRILVLSMWIIPTIVMLVLASVMWPATHRLAPQKSISSDVKPMKIQVVSMNWKWVFFYPEQNIATVNFVQIPINTPVTFEMTADESPMSSFWIPNLSGQMYTMTGHVNKLNILAEISGEYNGNSAEINGNGFAHMKFIARVGSVDEFNSWVKKVKNSNGNLDTTSYDQLLKPSENNPVTLYGTYNNNLFDKIIHKYRGSHGIKGGLE